MDSKIKLYTLPFAGGSSFSYMQWKKYLSRNIEIISLDYPGHGRRIKYRLSKDFREVVEDIVDQIKCDNLDKAPFVIYGHSMGGMVAYLSSVDLEKYYNLIPEKVIIGACKCPDAFNSCTKEKVNYNIIVKELLDGHRITKEIADTVEFKKNIYPIIENDFEMIREFDNMQWSKVKIGSELICLYGGMDETVQYSNIVGWKEYTKKTLLCKMINSGHFFLEEKAKEVCDIVNELLIS